jgi:hypothetical protein
MTDIPSARSLVEHVVRALEALGGHAERGAIKERLWSSVGSPRRNELSPFTPSASDSSPSELHYRLGWAISHAKNAG